MFVPEQQNNDHEKIHPQRIRRHHIIHWCHISQSKSNPFVHRHFIVWFGVYLPERNQTTFASVGRCFLFVFQPPMPTPILTDGGFLFRMNPNKTAIQKTFYIVNTTCSKHCQYIRFVRITLNN
jgi:hypothetical protein